MLRWCAHPARLIGGVALAAVAAIAGAVDPGVPAGLAGLGAGALWWIGWSVRASAKQQYNPAGAATSALISAVPVFVAGAAHPDASMVVHTLGWAAALAGAMLGARLAHSGHAMTAFGAGVFTATGLGVVAEQSPSMAGITLTWAGAEVAVATATAGIAGAIAALCVTSHRRALGAAFALAWAATAGAGATAVDAQSAWTVVAAGAALIALMGAHNERALATAAGALAAATLIGVLDPTDTAPNDGWTGAEYAAVMTGISLTLAREIAIAWWIGRFAPRGAHMLMLMWAFGTWGLGAPNALALGADIQFAALIAPPWNAQCTGGSCAQAIALAGVAHGAVAIALTWAMLRMRARTRQ